MTNVDERIVVLVDMDCFFCQVEVKLQPELRGKPLAVVQFNQWQQAGGIIAVNYEARDHGVSRHMRPKEAKEKCPDLILATVPGVRGKADTSRYRTAGREVVEVLRKHSNLIERASVDEAYLDITELVNKEMTSNHPSLTELIERLPNTFVIGYSTPGNNDEVHRREAVTNWINSAYGESEDVQSQKLAIAAIIVERIRADVYKSTGYRCSAGVSHNKILAKLACGLHKPNRQTILPLAGVASLYQTLPVKKIRNLGGKFGDAVIEALGCNVMADLLSYSLRDLQTRFDDKTGLWLYNIARGTDNKPVTNRLISKSIGSCKNFPGKQAIVTKEMLEHWVKQLSLEMNERLDQDLEENNRKATSLTVSYHYRKDKKTINQSRSYRLTSNKAEVLMKNCLDIINKFAKYPIVYMGMSASKFIDINKGTTSFRNFFTANSPSDKVPDKLSPTSMNLTKVTSSAPVKFKTTEVGDAQESSICTDECSITFSTPNEKKSSWCNINCENSASINVVNSEKTHDIKSPMSLLRSENTNLKPANFKKSFFMNILNTNKTGIGDEALDGIKNDNENGKELTIENINDVAILDLVSSENSNDVIICRADLGNGSTSGMRLNSPIEDHHLKNDNVKNSILSNLSSVRASKDVLPISSKIEKNKSNYSVDARTQSIDRDEDTAVKLQDIFPDLSNLDESIIAILPPRLQQEANLILRTQRKLETKNKINTVKPGQQKAKEQKSSLTKSVAQVHVNKIDTFFNNKIETASNSNNNELVENCPKCNRLIPLSEYLEHIDFHLAQNLSKEINKPLARGSITLPEKNISNGKSVKRKIDKPKSQQTQKRPKGITAFFS